MGLFKKKATVQTYDKKNKKLVIKISVYTVNRFLQDNLDSFDLVEWVLFDCVTHIVYEAEVDNRFTYAKDTFSFFWFGKRIRNSCYVL